MILNRQRRLKCHVILHSQVQAKLNAVKESNATLNGEINTYNGLLQSGGSLNNQSNSLGMTDFAPIGSDGFNDLTTTSEMDTMSMRATVSALSDLNVVQNFTPSMVSTEQTAPVPCKVLNIKMSHK
jgi:hypothetical protein